MLLASILVVGLAFWLMKKLFVSSRGKQRLTPNDREKEKDKFDYEVAIVGSGVLGSALAAVLGRDGRKVVVVERDLKMPDRVVGEFLQPGGCRALRKLGLGECLDGIDAQNIFGYVVHDHNSDKIDINYPLDGEESSGGRAFHHGRFVMNLRKAAMAEKNITYLEGNVINLLEEADVIKGIIYKSKDKNEPQVVRAKLTVVADGCFSRLRKSLVSEMPEQKSTFVGLLLMDCPQSRPHYAELVLTDSSPVLVYQISERSTRLFVDIKGQKVPKNIREYLEEEIYHQLPDHLRGPFREAAVSGPIKSMPNSFLPPSPVRRDGAIALGDAFNMRHPLTGGGMSVAFHDVVILRELLTDLEDLTDREALHRLSRQFYGRRKSSHSFVVNVLSMSLYELFSADDEWLKRLQKACFKYFKRGGSCISGPVALLSVLQPRPLLFLFHFFSVALYAMYFTFKGHGVTGFRRSLTEAACVALKACSVVFPLVWAEAKTVVL